MYYTNRNTFRKNVSCNCITIRHIIRTWKDEIYGQIYINNNTTINSVPYSDDLTIIRIPAKINTGQ